MNIKNGIVALAFWTLLLAPVLCGLGVLVHSCLCEADSDCHHELHCVTDPCQILVVGVADHHSRDGDWLDQAERSFHDAVIAGVMDPTAIRTAERIVALEQAPPRPLDDDRILPLIC